MQNNKSTKILTIITIASVIAAFYFSIKIFRINNAQKTSIDASIGENSSFEQQKSIKYIDSLLAEGNYEKAFSVSKELNTLESNNINPDLNLRFKIAKDFVELSKQNQITQEKIQNDTLVDFDKKTVSAGKENSPSNLELQQAKLEIKSLRNKLSLSKASEYMTFKTSKGTKLYYVGDVKNGKANGYGIAILETGSRYEGQWNGNLRHGQGKFYWNDGEDYEGDYRNDMRDGFGTYHWSNGEKYVGEWQNDRRNGKGEFYNKRGKLKTSGIWKDDVLVEEN